MLCLPSAADNFFVIVPLFLAGAAASSGFFATGSLPVSFCFFAWLAPRLLNLARFRAIRWQEACQNSERSEFRTSSTEK